MKIAKVNNKYIVSGFLDISQEKNLIKTGFNNKIFEVFNTEEAIKFIEMKGGLKK